MLEIIHLVRPQNFPKILAWRRYGVFIVNSEEISHLVLVFLLVTLNM